MELLKTAISENDTLAIEQIGAKDADMFNKPIDENYTALSYAVANLAPVSVQYMLNHGADINQVSPNNLNIQQILVLSIKKALDKFTEITDAERGAAYYQFYTTYLVVLSISLQIPKKSC